MKKTLFILFFLLILTLFSQVIFANATQDTITDSLNNEIQNFSNSLPNNVKEQLPNEALNGDYSALINGTFGEKEIFSILFSYLTAGINSVLKSFASILALLVIIGLFNTVSTSFFKSNLSSTFSICSTLCVSITVFGICNILVNNACEFISVLCNTMRAFLPIMIGLLTISGSASSAVVSNGSILLIINIVEGFIVTYLLPITKICLAFGCVKALSNSCDFSGVTKIIKSTFTSVTVFTMSILMFVLSYKSTLSQGVDTLSLKTARFAIGSFVPLVGSSVNDALRTVSSSLSLVKSTYGTIAIIAIALIMLPIIINLFLHKLSFSILTTISKAMNGGGEGAILEEADTICGFMLTMVCCTSVLFIFALTVFIKSGVSLQI